MNDLLDALIAAKLAGGGGGGGGTGLTDDVKQALLNCFAHVAWIDDQGQSYYDALEDALYHPAELLSISAVFEQGQTVIYDTDSLDDLKPMLTVTANYSDGTSSIVTDYTLSGTLTEGTSTITVSYGGKTTTFDVEVTHSLVPSGYTMVDYITSAVHGTPSTSHLTTTPYIKTNFPSADVDAADYTVELEFTLMFGAVNCCPFGGRDGTNAGTTTKGTVLTYDPAGPNGDTLIFGNTSGQNTCIISNIGHPFTVGQKSTFKLENKKIYVDGVLLSTISAESAVQLAAYKWVLFGRNNGGNFTASNSGGPLSPMIGKVYSFAIKDGNGDYVLRYIPCKRNSDNVYGMYDTVSETFLTSAIATGFSGGDD